LWLAGEENFLAVVRVVYRMVREPHTAERSHQQFKQRGRQKEEEMMLAAILSGLVGVA
jgi:hypothetical protein